MKTNEETTKLPKSKKHGAIISFSPSKEYLGANTKLPVDDIEDWLDKISYLLPPKRKIKIHFTVTEGFTTIKDVVFKSKPFDQLLDNLLDKENIISKKAKFSGSSHIMETIGNEEKKKTINMEVAFLYVNPEIISNPIFATGYDTYCNFTRTVSGGVHKDTMDECLCRFLVPKTKATLTNREKDMDIKWEDVRTGLNCVINLSTNAQVDFQGNTKEEIGNKKLVEPLKEIINKGLTEFFEKEPDILRDMLKIVKMNAKVRIEANKVRTKVTKETITRFNEHNISNFRSASGKDYVTKKELFLIEGETSAMGSAVDGRDPVTQALYGFKGNTKNPLKSELSKILDPKTGNMEWVNYIDVLGCGYGRNFDLSKLKYDKIIIMTDADVDGYGITEGIALFHLYVIPEVVQAGCLYKVVPPLYSVGHDKDKLTYARNKDELTEIHYKSVVSKIKITSMRDKKEFNKAMMKEFLYDTVYYFNDLTHAAKHYGVNEFFLERIVSFLSSTIPNLDEDTDLEAKMEDKKFRTNLIAFVQEKFPEIKLEGTSSLRGIVDLKEQSIQITNRMLNYILLMVEPIRKYGHSFIVTENVIGTKVLSIGEIRDLANKYVAHIYSRFKGLGEMDAIELWNTTMNPETRVLMRLTSEDLVRELTIFDVLNGPKAKDRLERKKMMRGLKIRLEDLDN